MLPKAHASVPIAVAVGTTDVAMVKAGSQIDNDVQDYVLSTTIPAATPFSVFLPQVFRSYPWQQAWGSAGVGKSNAERSRPGFPEEARYFIVGM